MFFFFNDTATTEIYTLSLHDALPISVGFCRFREVTIIYLSMFYFYPAEKREREKGKHSRSEEHTSELQSRQYLVCRLLLEKKKNLNNTHTTNTPSLHPIHMWIPPLSPSTSYSYYLTSILFL